MKGKRTPFFAIVMPLFNKRDYILRAVDSVLSQTFGDFELLVVDDGSTDGSGEFLRESRKDPRLKVLRQRNSGISVARNRCLTDARAPFVNFLDADDEFLPGYLEAVQGLIRRFPGAGAYGTDTYLKRRWRRVRWHHPDIPPGYEGVLRDYFRLILKRYPIHVTSMMVRRSIFRRVGPFQVGMKNGQDLDMWLRIALVAPIVYLDRPLTVYHRDAGDTTVDKPLRDYRPAYRTLQKALRDPRLKQPQREWVREYENKVRIKEIRTILIQGKRKEARELLLSLRTTRFQRMVRLLLFLSRIPFNVLAYHKRLRKLV